MMDGYVVSVADALELRPELSDIAPVPQIPRRRERVLDMPDLDMGMLDFLSLYGCELQYVVGEKNSIMGRVMQPLNRLRYETRFIRAAETCISDTDGEGIQEELEEAIAHKTEALPVAVWNATWGVEEIERLFTLSQGYYPGSDDDKVLAELSSGVKRVNQTVRGLLDGNTSEPLDYVGGVHQLWQAEHRAGQLLNSARLMTARLDDATALLVKRVEGVPLCSGSESEEPPGELVEIYTDGYVGGIKDYLDRIEHAKEALIKPLDTLAAQQTETMPSAFRDWYRLYLDTGNTDSVWGQLGSAVTAHKERWRQLLSQCGTSLQ
ncbi:hypothetical protein MDG893_09446 [Marinobacter algicola DG893]|uniref:DUF3080 domain-containing protein n=2 Tax=Marinobacter algicola TaxID=236100 RepID=A6F3E1_9GAMM|nr:hypothetical protein MDG893_09446 [Marinobacter algicola DG893]